MNPERRKQSFQVIVLIILLIGLGFSMWHMLRTVQGSAPPQQVEQVPSPATAGERLSEVAATPPPAAGAAGAAAAPAEAVQPLDATGELEMNPNLFRVYRIAPPKNPFKREEAWYTEKLEEIPGYPELRDTGFLETMSPVVPNMDELLPEDEAWREVTLTKTEQDRQYSISGYSEDETIATELTFMGPEGRSIEVAWHPGMGVPVTALSDPSVAQNFVVEDGHIPAAMPPDSDLFAEPGEGLQIPGIDELLTGGVVPGDQLACHGVSGLEERATALVSFNGTTRLVTVGDSLPPRYQVQAITADGVVLLNLRSEDTYWLPISAPTVQEANGAAAGGPTGSIYMPQPMPPVVGGRA